MMGRVLLPMQLGEPLQVQAVHSPTMQSRGMQHGWVSIVGSVHGQHDNWTTVRVRCCVPQLVVGSMAEQLPQELHGFTMQVGHAARAQGMAWVSGTHLLFWQTVLARNCWPVPHVTLQVDHAFHSVLQLAQGSGQTGTGMHLLPLKY